MSVAKGSSGPMPLACNLSATLHDTLSRTLSTTASFISTMLGRMLCVTPALHFNWIRWPLATLVASDATLLCSKPISSELHWSSMRSDVTGTVTLLLESVFTEVGVWVFAESTYWQQMNLQHTYHSNPYVFIVCVFLNIFGHISTPQEKQSPGSCEWEERMWLNKYW